MKKQASFKERFGYWFDNTLSRGTIAIITWLGIISFLIILIAATILAMFNIPAGEEPTGFFEDMWVSLMRTLDAGNLAGDNGFGFRTVSFFVTIGGIFIVSIFIGTLTSGIEGKLEELRKGRSRVLETGHTLILGWSPKIYTIISEIMTANQNLRNQHIVIMSTRDKVEMEDDLAGKVPSSKSTSIICRSGNPLDLHDIEIVSPHDAKSIIILCDTDPFPDINTIKTIMAITSNPNRKKEAYHIVAEIQNPDNMEATTMVGKEEATILQTPDILARLTAQTCRQSGLSIVYNELLDFDGVEIYIKKEPSLGGKTFREALFMYESSAIIGIIRADGTVLINPSPSTVLNVSDQVIGFAEDDDKFTLSGKISISPDKTAISAPVKEVDEIEKKLILGWNSRTPNLIRELDRYLHEGSEIIIIAEYEDLESKVEAAQKMIKNGKLTLKQGDSTDRKTLETVDMGLFRDIIVVGYDNTDVQIADAKTLISLLHIRNQAAKANVNPNIVSEMFDVRNRDLAEVAEADDFIISERIISLMISQLAENKLLEKVFNILFAAEGSEIYLKPASNYIIPGKTADFYTVVESAIQQNEIAIGYRLKSDENDSAKNYGVVVNPDKSKKINFTSEDKIIVVSE